MTYLTKDTVIGSSHRLMQQILLLAVVTRFTSIWCEYEYTVCKIAANFSLPIAFSYNPSLQKKSVYRYIWTEIMLTVSSKSH